MRIVRLHLYGFKSFADRTVVELGEGVSCIVGPNGSGKSNVFDAVKWAVGEQSARALRGADMTDVIFAGSATRPPVGFAEVALVFTCEGGEPFPPPYTHHTEVTVARRLHRTGNSDYLINDKKVRRKDVIDLFRDTGIGSSNYSFIEQGRIGEIIHARPEERRTLVDEAAGISRYKARRKEALSRLEATLGQLDRAADVVDELERRLQVLEGQVVGAARHRYLRERIRQEEIVLALAKYADLAADRRALRQRTRDAATKADTAEREVARRAAELVTRREELELAREASAVRRDELAEHDARRRELASGLNLRRDAVAVAEAEVERARSARGEAAAEKELAHREAHQADVRLQALRQRAADSLGVEAEAAAVLEARLAERAISAAKVSATDQQVAETAALLAAWRARRAALEERAEALERQRHGLSGSGSSADDQVAAAVAEAGRAADARVEAARRAAAARVARDAAAREASTVDEALAQARAEASRRAAAEAAARRELAIARRARERAVAEARARADAVGARARVDAERRVKAAVMTARAAVDSVDRQAAEAREAARVRGEAWLGALQAQIAAAAELAEDAFAAAAAERDAATEAALRVALDDGEVAVAQAVAEVDGREGAESRRAEAARDTAAAAMTAARAEDAAARAAFAEAQAALGAARGDLQGADARLRAALRGAGGRAAVRAALPGASTLVELAPHIDSEQALRLGERVLVPLVDDATDVEAAAAAARRGGAAAVLWRGSPALAGAGDDGESVVAALAARVTVVDTLAEALALHARHGGAVVVRTGERVDADGMVRVGGAADPGAEARAAKTGAEQARERVAACEAAIAGAASRRDRAAAQLGAAEAELDTREATLRGARERWSAARRSAENAAREHSRATVDGLRRAAAVASEAARAEEVARAASRREAAAQRVRRDRDGLQAGWNSVVALWRTRRAEALEAAEAAEAAARVEAEDVVEALRAAAAEQVRVAEGELATAAADEEAREEVLSAETAVAREALSQAEAASRSARSAAAAAADAARDADLALVRAEGAVEAAAAAGARASDRVAAVVRERDALGAAEDALARDVARLDADKAGVEAAVEQARAARAEASRELHDHDQTVEAARSAAAQAVAATAGLRAGVEAAERAVEAARRRAGELGRAEERERERLAIAEASVGELQRAIGVTEQHLEEVTALVDAARERLSETRERVARQAEAVHSGEAELSARTTEAETARTRATALDADAKETQREVEELRGRIDERYGLSLPGLLDRLEALGAARLDPDPAATEEVRVGDQVVPAVEPMIVRSETLRDQAEIRKVVRDNTRHRKELVALGEVNLLAVDEFRDLTRRYEELIGQREDLEAAVASIRQAIAKMNRTCRQLFRDAFDAVNEEFQRVYPRLVGGGNARLTLTDEEDLLETGVDIFVRPPGKRLQNLTLLSGGEKAMAAIAVILALFRVRPSPFCLLDEVDAPLDEANGARFNEVLVEMSSVSQFIVITHNRKTMECADTLYGVVMSEPGSSRLVSVQLGGAT